jgi:hypothetical protein
MMPNVLVKKFSIAVCVLTLLTLPARAVNWGPFIDGVLDHLAAHMSREAAERIVELVTRGQKIPTLQMTDEKMKKYMDDFIAKCVQRAKWLDDNDPLRQHVPGAASNGFAEYRQNLESYRGECGDGPRVN